MGNPKDRKKRHQLYWRKVAALMGPSRPPTKRTSVHPQVYKKGRSGFPAFWIGLKMNFDTSATHLQIRARLPRSGAPESAPEYGSTLLEVELQSRKV